MFTYVWKNVEDIFMEQDYIELEHMFTVIYVTMHFWHGYIIFYAFQKQNQSYCFLS